MVVLGKLPLKVLDCCCCGPEDVDSKRTRVGIRNAVPGILPCSHPYNMYPPPPSTFQEKDFLPLEAVMKFKVKFREIF